MGDLSGRLNNLSLDCFGERAPRRNQNRYQFANQQPQRPNEVAQDFIFTRRENRQRGIGFNRKEVSHGAVPIIKDESDRVFALFQISLSAMRFDIKADPLRGRSTVRESSWETAARKVFDETQGALDLRNFEFDYNRGDRNRSDVFFIRLNLKGRNMQEILDAFDLNAERFPNPNVVGNIFIEITPELRNSVNTPGDVYIPGTEIRIASQAVALLGRLCKLVLENERMDIFPVAELRRYVVNGTTSFCSIADGDVEDLDDNPPHADGDVEDSNDNPPRTDGDVEDLNDNPPRADGDVEDLDDNPPHADGDVEDLNDNPPRADGDVEDLDDNPPHADENEHGEGNEETVTQCKTNAIFREQMRSSFHAHQWVLRRSHLRMHPSDLERMRTALIGQKGVTQQIFDQNIPP
eukprot:gene4024-6464_t